MSLAISCTDGSEPRREDAEALVALYNSTDGLNWEDNTNWLTDAPISDWAGVTASDNTVNGRSAGECVVRRLYLSYNQLSRTIPAELGNLLNLESLDLGDNQLSRTIPAELGNLLNLESLDLGDNQLSGTIPAELGNLLNLESLDLGDNQLSGTIPAELGNLLNLESLDLGDNQLSGTIPAELGNLLNLRLLDLGENQLSGTIPIELGNLLHLGFLGLNNNQLTGEIPAELGRIRHLYLVGNQLSGEISIEPGKIPNLGLDGNQLSGGILPPNGTNPQYAWDGSTILISWDAVDGADYYNVYHNPFSDDYCSLSSDGVPSFCDELATNVSGTSYLHSDPDSSTNYYWVAACNSDGCSEIDSENPARPAIEKPDAPSDVTFALEGSTVRVSWMSVSGADYYKVYYDDFFDSSCSLSRDGTPLFCEELAASVTETTYVHSDPDDDENYYWIVA